MTATNDVIIETSPWIVMGERDHERLSRLAAGAVDTMPEAASRLLSELERAEVIADGRLPRNVVTMGSTVEFISGAAAPRRVQLVYPASADISQGRISIMTPVGAALIGLSSGQSITWLGLDGQERWLTVLTVEPALEDA